MGNAHQRPRTTPTPTPASPRHARPRQRRGATRLRVESGPNSPSISATAWPSSMSGPPMASKPSGGKWSSGMRLPIEGCGTLIKTMRMIGPLLLPSETRRRLERQGLQAAEPAFAALERYQRLGERFGVEFGPHPVGEVQFGVRPLPEQEIGQPFLTAGADDEIDVAKPRLSGHELREHLAGRLTHSGEFCRRIQDRVARRIVDR